MTTEHGIVVNVTETTAGTDLDADAAATDTVLVVANPEDFIEDGGRFQVRDIDGTMLAPVVTYSSYDADASTITLPEALGIALTAGVRIEPIADDGLVPTERVAFVQLDTTAATDDPIPAVVPDALFDRLPEGARDPGVGESVLLERGDRDGDEWRIVDVLAQGDSPTVLARGLIAGPPDGAHVTLDSTGMKGYNAVGSTTLSFDTTTGNLEVVGAMGTGQPGTPAVYMTSTSWTSPKWGEVTEPSIFWDNASTQVDKTRIYSDDIGSPNLYLTSGREATSNRCALVKLDGGSAAYSVRARIGVTDTTNPAELSTNGGNMLDIQNGAMALYSSGTISIYATNGVTLQNSGLTIWGGLKFTNGGSLYAGDTFYFRNLADTAYRDINCGSIGVTGRVLTTADVTAGAGLFDTAMAGGGSTAANVNNNGRIVRATSSRKYKTNIVDLAAPERVLDLVPREFDWQGYEELFPDGTHALGLIAEEVAQAFPMLATYDEEGEPNGVDYAAVVVPLLAVVKDLVKRIETLENGVAA